MKSQLIQVRINGQPFVGWDTDRENIVQDFEDIGFRLVGYANYPKEHTMWAEHNGRSYRFLLNGWPQFEYLAGPMWDGDHVRYETAEANDIFSR